MYKKLLILSLLSLTFQMGSYAQLLHHTNLSGSFETTNIFYADDQGIGFTAPDDKMGSNSYLTLNYSSTYLFAGLQYESYLPPVLGYPAQPDGNKLIHKFIGFRNNYLEVIAGSFYEQFGSGVILRTYEDRQLGINNALEGVNITFKPLDYLAVKAVYGTQREYLDFGEGKIRGIDGSLDISQMFWKEARFSFTAGFSAVNRYQSYTGPEENFPAAVNALAGRVNFSSPHYGISAEYAEKGNDPNFQNDYIHKTGSGLLVNTYYVHKNLGLNLSFRRLENMDFRSEREATDHVLYVNYLPALTKPHKYSLPNFYPYTTQTLGEIGGQADFYINLKKGTWFGGTYGTKISINYALYHNLDSTRTSSPKGFISNFFSAGNQQIFQDINVEIDKKWSSKLKTLFNGMLIHYDKAVLEGGPYPVIRSKILVADIQYKITPQQSVRTEWQHLWTEQDKKNWLALLCEYSLAPKWSFFALDLWNYGNPDEKNHYYNLGGSFSHHASRISLSYGRQREGLICVGGICRRVPAYSGLTVSLNTRF